MGSGTSIAVASDLGLDAVGVDGNPAAVVISRARLAKARSIRLAEQALQRIEPTCSARIGADPLVQWLDDGSAAFVRGVTNHFLTTEIEQLDEMNCVGLTALFLALRKELHSLRGTNPTWTKVRLGDDRISIDRPTVLRTMTEMISGWKPGTGSPAQIALADSRKLPFEDASFDIVIGSPPYANRLDYAVHTKVELAVLGYSDDRFRALRRSLFGNALALQPSVISGGLPCVDRLLTTIKCHDSYAAAGYYWKTYACYFEALIESLHEIDRVASSSAQLVLVVQNSYFKEIEIPLADIVVEALGSWDFAHHRFEIKSTRAGMNPQTRKNRLTTGAVESVLVGTRT